MQDSLTGGLLLTIIDMVIVFAVLFGLAWMVRLISAVVGRGAPAQAKPSSSGAEAPAPKAADEGRDSNLPGIISAAIAAYEEDEAGPLFESPAAQSLEAPALGRAGAWAVAGRMSIMNGRESFGRSWHGAQIQDNR